MDADRFDALTRSLPLDRSRRGVLRLLTGILGGSLPLLAHDKAEARCRRRPCRNGTCAGCCDAKGCCRAGTRDSACGVPITKVNPPCEACSGATPRCFEGVCSECREDLHCSLEEFCDSGSCTHCKAPSVDCSRDRECCSRCCDSSTTSPTAGTCLALIGEGGTKCRGDDDCCPGLKCAIPRGEVSGTCKKPR